MDRVVDPPDPSLDGGECPGEVDHVVVTVACIGDLGTGLGAQGLARLAQSYERVTIEAGRCPVRVAAD